MGQLGSTDQAGMDGRPCAVAPTPGARAVLVLDLENLLFPFFDEDLGEGVAQLERMISALERELTFVMKVACSSKWLAARVAIPLAEMGIRTFVHRGGPDAADEDLVRRLEDQVPPSCEVAVIGSGDHLFALPARRLQMQGKKVIAIARPGSMSQALRSCVEGLLWLRDERPDQAA